MKARRTLTITFAAAALLSTAAVPHAKPAAKPKPKCKRALCFDAAEVPGTAGMTDPVVAAAGGDIYLTGSRRSGPGGRTPAFVADRRELRWRELPGRRAEGREEARRAGVAVTEVGQAWQFDRGALSGHLTGYSGDARSLDAPEAYHPFADVLPGASLPGPERTTCQSTPPPAQDAPGWIAAPVNGDGLLLVTGALAGADLETKGTVPVLQAGRADPATGKVSWDLCVGGPPAAGSATQQPVGWPGVPALRSDGAMALPQPWLNDLDGAVLRVATSSGAGSAAFGEPVIDIKDSGLPCGGANSGHAAFDAAGGLYVAAASDADTVTVVAGPGAPFTLDAGESRIVTGLSLTGSRRGGGVLLAYALSPAGRCDSRTWYVTHLVSERRGSALTASPATPVGEDCGGGQHAGTALTSDGRALLTTGSCDGGLVTVHVQRAGPGL